MNSGTLTCPYHAAETDEDVLALLRQGKKPEAPIDELMAHHHSKGNGWAAVLLKMFAHLTKDPQVSPVRVARQIAAAVDQRHSEIIEAHEAMATASSLAGGAEASDAGFGHGVALALPTEKHGIHATAVTILHTVLQAFENWTFGIGHDDVAKDFGEEVRAIA